MRERTAPWSQPQPRWHLADWGWWGWTETAVKLVAIGTALTAAADGGAWAVPATHRFPFVVLVAIATGYLGTVIDRFLDREVLAMVFVVAMLIGHWALVFAMGQTEWPATSVRVFTGLMLLGDLVKLGFFVTTRTRVRQLPRLVPIAMTGVLAAAYLAAFLTT